MDFQHQVNYSDTTYIDLTTNQIKRLHDEVFGKTIQNESAMDIVVKLELAYIPFLIFIIVMITAVNLRWNKAYKRIVALSDKIPKTEGSEKTVTKLKIQKVNIFDRFFVYFVIWGSSLYIDTLMLASGLFRFPWLAIPVIIFVITKKIKRLATTSSLIGVDDSDIIKNFEEIVNSMVIHPLFEGVSSSIKKIFKNKEQ